MQKQEPGWEQEVWQRVFAQPERSDHSGLRQLLLTGMELAGMYRQLTETLTGKPRELAKRLYQGELANVACLKGVWFLSDCREEIPQPASPAREPVKRILLSSYHRSRRSMAEYTARSLDAQYGEVFRKMAQREGEHCALIAQLLGSIP